MTTQPDLFQSTPADSKATPAECSDFRAHLISAGTWQTRAQLCAVLGWTERKVRAVAEALGADVVRSQDGFKLLAQITPEEQPIVRQAIATFRGQAQKMEDYARSLAYRLATLIE